MFAADTPNFFETVALPWARAAAAAGNVAATNAVLSHDAVANELEGHKKAHTSWTKIANYKGKPEAQAKARKLVDA